MDRRGFIRLIAGAGLAVALPVKALAAIVGEYRVERRSVMFDYEVIRGLGVSITVGAQRYRHALAIPEETWQQMTRGQREATWKRLEAFVVERMIGPVERS